MIMNKYYAELLDVTKENDIILYGYAFTGKDIREAKLHATDVSRQMGAVPLPSVWRVDKERFSWMIEKYATPTRLEEAQ